MSQETFCPSSPKCLAFILALSLIVIPSALAENSTKAVNTKESASQELSADYRRRLEQYVLTRRAFDDEMAAYWKAIGEKRQIRNEKRRNKSEIVIDDYVLIQPPIYFGPAKPTDPFSSTESEIVSPRPDVPVVADFLKFAAEKFRFIPQRPQTEMEFKKAYARVAAAAGLTKDQAVRIYGFEAGGNGTYDVQAGLEYEKPGARAISTALGYNQLLSANSVELLAEQGDQFVSQLKKKTEGLSSENRKTLDQKVSIILKMIMFSRTVPDTWGEHVRLGRTPEGLGIHALNLDIDVGPLLQTQKLLNSVNFALRKGLTRPLSAAELEMMNLTGDGNGIDMVQMPTSFREQIPTSNFFQQSGYERNGVARRNNVVSKLLAATDAKMDNEVTLPGARNLANAF